MEYTESHFKLSKAFSSDQQSIEVEDKIIQRFSFHSVSHDILPGLDIHHCKEHNLDFNESYSFSNNIGDFGDIIHVKDTLVDENQDFTYFIIRPAGFKTVNRVTFMLHGFNEKNWDKYFSWGNALCDRTQGAVVFFPLAFHMQRAPLKWSDKREMFLLSELRKKLFPDVVDSSLINVASSVRLHYMPQRFIWSGLQSYYDIIQLIEDCKQGKHSLIDREFTFNIFAYSIGGLVAEVLRLSNYRNYFSDTKVCLFCSGSVFNRMSPVSKYILDSEATVAMYSYLTEHLDHFFKKDSLLQHYMNGDHLEGKVFYSMLRYNRMREFRENLFRKAANSFYAIPLHKDAVIPSNEVVDTLKGAYRDIDIRIEEMDFNYPYSHESPFPINKSDSKLVDFSFSTVFDKAGAFLK